MSATQYFAFVNTIINIIVITIFIFAFLKAERNLKIILAIILTLLFLLPRIFHGSPIFWICYVGKIIFGIGCYLYFKAAKY
jgi:hypothetical protein